MGATIGPAQGGGTMTATEIKEALETLTGDDRLDADYVKDIPSGGGSDNIELITEQTVSGSAVASIDFTSLDLSAYYKVELIGGKVKTTAGTNQELKMQLNGITSSVYYSVSQNPANFVSVGVAFVGGDADISTPIITFIRPGSTDERKSWRVSASNYTSTTVLISNIGNFGNALAQATREAAITSIKLFGATGNLDIGTNVKIIGYKY